MLIDRLRYACLCLALSVWGCSTPTEPLEPGFGEARVFPTHREVDLNFVSEDGAVLSGTLYLPLSTGPHPAIVFHFGFGEWTRARFDNSAIPAWTNAGIAVLSYDKRGVGRSQGACCPWKEPGYYALLATDVMAAVRIVRTHSNVDAGRVGVWGFSEGGYVVPIAATRADDEIAFSIIGSGPGVTQREELLYSYLIGEDRGCQPSGLSEEEIYDIIDGGKLDFDPIPFIDGSGFDPIPIIKQMTNPGLWVYGDLDTSVPVQRSMENLEQIRNEFDKDFTIIVLENANHSWVEGGAMCQESGRFVDALTPIFGWLLPRLFPGGVP